MVSVIDDIIFVRRASHKRALWEKEANMPKLKTHKGAAKRFRTTATGKVKRGHSHARHILTKKSSKRKRFLDVDVLVSESDEGRIKSMLPYGRG